MFTVAPNKKNTKNKHSVKDCNSNLFIHASHTSKPKPQNYVCGSAVDSLTEVQDKVACVKYKSVVERKEAHGQKTSRVKLKPV